MHKLIIHLLEIGGPTKDTDWKELGEQFGFSATRKGKAAQDCWRNYEKSLGKKNVIEFKTRLGLNLDEEDRVVIDELDTLAEDSEHAGETGVAEAPLAEAVRAADAVREFPRRAAS